MSTAIWQAIVAGVIVTAAAAYVIWALLPRRLRLQWLRRLDAQRPVGRGLVAALLRRAEAAEAGACGRCGDNTADSRRP
jgi:hypothetical protein